MEYSTSTSIDFKHREIAVIVVFFSMPKNKAEDQLLRLQHSPTLWQPDMQNLAMWKWWASASWIQLKLACQHGQFRWVLDQRFPAQYSSLSTPAIVWDLSSISFWRAQPEKIMTIHSVASCSFYETLRHYWWLFLERRGLTPSSINSSFF